MSEINPLLREEPIPDDNDRALRPKSLDEFIGQAEARSNLRVFIESARPVSYTHLTLPTKA